MSTTPAHRPPHERKSRSGGKRTNHNRSLAPLCGKSRRTPPCGYLPHATMRTARLAAVETAAAAQAAEAGVAVTAAAATGTAVGAAAAAAAAWVAAAARAEAETEEAEVASPLAVVVVAVAAVAAAGWAAGDRVKAAGEVLAVTVGMVAGGATAREARAAAGAGVAKAEVAAMAVRC